MKRYLIHKNVHQLLIRVDISTVRGEGPCAALLQCRLVPAVSRSATHFFGVHRSDAILLSSRYHSRTQR